MIYLFIYSCLTKGDASFDSSVFHSHEHHIYLFIHVQVALICRFTPSVHVVNRHQIYLIWKYIIHAFYLCVCATAAVKIWLRQWLNKYNSFLFIPLTPPCSLSLIAQPRIFNWVSRKPYNYSWPKLGSQCLVGVLRSTDRIWCWQFYSSQYNFATFYIRQGMRRTSVYFLSPRPTPSGPCTSLSPTGGPPVGTARGGRFPGTFTVTRSRSISFPGVFSM